MEVVNGARGFLLCTLESISLILNLDLLIIFIALSISVLFKNENFLIISPLKRVNLEKMFLLSLLVKFEFKVQYSSGLNNSILCSLSVINFKATDCTLPADFDPGSLDHKIGEILKPTR